MVLIMIIAAICFAFCPIIVHCEKTLIFFKYRLQRSTETVVSDSLGLVDFAIGFVFCS